MGKTKYIKMSTVGSDNMIGLLLLVYWAPAPRCVRLVELRPRTLVPAGMMKRSPINHHEGRWNVYFRGPDGHNLELLTRTRKEGHPHAEDSLRRRASPATRARSGRRSARSAQSANDALFG
jgi:hypothetical protein